MLTDKHQNYREILRQILIERMKKNSSYSMRSMANQLKISPTTLSDVLKGKKNFSREMGFQVASHLQLNEVETERFILLIEYATSKRAEQREKVLSKLRSLHPEEDFEDLSLDRFKLISDWYHFAILSLTQLEEADLSPSAIAKRLRITPFEAEDGLQRLLRLKLIARDKTFGIKCVVANPRVESATANQALRNYHRQMLHKAIESLETQTPNEKVIGSENICIDSDHLEEFRELTDRYLKSARKLARKQSRKRQVYHLGVQFFKVT